MQYRFDDIEFKLFAIVAFLEVSCNSDVSVEVQYQMPMTKNICMIRNYIIH